MPQPNSDTNENNRTIPSNSEDELSPPPSSSKQSPAPSSPPNSKENPAPQSQQRSAQLEIKPTSDYYNWGKTSTAKINSSVPLGLPHSKATQMLYDYAFFQSDQLVSGSFVRVAQKGKVAKPDLPTLKQAMSGGEADE